MSGRWDCSPTYQALKFCFIGFISESCFWVSISFVVCFDGVYIFLKIVFHTECFLFKFI